MFAFFWQNIEATSDSNAIFIKEGRQPAYCYKIFLLMRNK